MKALLLLAALAGDARADVQRYAVIVGNNAGLGDEQTLRHAETDAQHVAELLAELGGVPDENQIVLRGKSVDAVKRALIAINDRIRTRQRAGDLAVLHVYYSGHGDADALHLGSGRLSLRDLDQLVHASAAEIRVLVIDACRSGGATRAKGKPLANDLAGTLGGTGTIVLTASTAGEDAQESDELGGSFFTHHFLSGLRGAADDNGDGTITVDEAFRYTRDRTIATSSRTLSGTQHPMFHYDVRGRGDVVLSELGSRRERGTLTLPGNATWLAFGNGVVSEIDAEAKRRTLSLRPGTYRVRGLTRDALLEGTVEVTANRDSVVDQSKLSRTMYARLVRKGRGRYLRTASGPVVAASSYELGLGGELGWTFVRPGITISPRIFGAWFPDSRASYYAQGGASVRVTRAWELQRFALDLGVVIGGSRLAHEFVEDPVSSRVVSAIHAVGTIGATVPIGPRAYVGTELGLGVLAPVGSGEDAGPMIILNLVGGMWL
jgi:hypothetical protein